MSDERHGRLCRVCRHDFYDFHVESGRIHPTTSELARRRCNDCSVCLEKDGAPTGARGRELTHV